MTFHETGTIAGERIINPFTTYAVSSKQILEINVIWLGT
jgi:hypothetical protein